MAEVSRDATARRHSGGIFRSLSLFRSVSLTIVTPAVAAVALLAVLFLPSSATTALAAATGDWPSYHHDAARTGVSSDQDALGGVQLAWTSVQLDGRLIYAQPLVVGDRVLVATEGNSLFALDAATGTVLWSKNLGAPVPRSDLPGGNIDPSGITGTPLVDLSSNTVFVVAFLRAGPHHELFALDLATGTVLWHRAIDPPGLSPLVEQQRGALALSGGRIYVAFGGLWGDIGQYKGAVVSAPADGSGALASYIVPTSRRGGMWNPSGPVVDSNGDLWVVTGNTISQTTFDYGNSVIRLSAGLSLLDFFAPTNWASLNAADLDLCTLAPVLLPGGRVLAVGKSGTAYLLNAGNLGHVGAALATANIGSTPFGTATVIGSRVFVPCSGALKALDVSANRVQVAWSVSGGAGSPIVAAGYVWTLGYDGKLKAVDPTNGSVVFTLQLGIPASRFVTLAAANGRLFVPDGQKVRAVSLHGPPSITSLNPKVGPVAGNQTVTINGMGFTGASAVTFGGTPAAAYTVNSLTRITATTPAHAMGPVDVVVTTANGSSATSSADQFTYVSIPTVTSLGPATATTSGGTGVIITGTYLTATSAVTFGGVAATRYTVNSSTQIMAIAPAHAAGSVQVQVTTPGGSSANTTADDLTYVAAPTATRAEQTATRLVWTGTWTLGSSSNYSGGSLRYVNSSGASVTASFTGTYLAWIAKKSPAYGIAKVTVDGLRVYTVNLYSSSTIYKRMVWNTGILSSGRHWVKIEWTGTKGASTGGTNVNLDAFDLSGSLTAATRFEQTDAHLVWTPSYNSWTTQSVSYNSGGSLKYINTTGSVTINFTGVRLTIIAKKSPNYGYAKVTLDGTTTYSVNLYASTTAYKVKVWSAPFLNPGDHTVKIEWTGTKGASTGGTSINLDAVDVIGVLR